MRSSIKVDNDYFTQAVAQRKESLAYHFAHVELRRTFNESSSYENKYQVFYGVVCNEYFKDPTAIEKENDKKLKELIRRLV